MYLIYATTTLSAAVSLNIKTESKWEFLHIGRSRDENSAHFAHFGKALLGASCLVDKV